MPSTVVSRGATPTVKKGDDDGQRRTREEVKGNVRQGAMLVVSNKDHHDKVDVSHAGRENGQIRNDGSVRQDVTSGVEDKINGEVIEDDGTVQEAVPVVDNDSSDGRRRRNDGGENGVIRPEATPVIKNHKNNDKMNDRDGNVDGEVNGYGNDNELRRNRDNDNDRVPQEAVQVANNDDDKDNGKVSGSDDGNAGGSGNDYYKNDDNGLGINHDNSDGVVLQEATPVAHNNNVHIGNVDDKRKVSDNGNGLRRTHDNGKGIVQQEAMQAALNNNNNNNIDDSDKGKISDSGNGIRRNHDNGNGTVRQEAMPVTFNNNRDDDDDDDDNIDDSDNGKISDNVDGKVKDDGNGIRRNHDNGNGTVRQEAMPVTLNNNRDDDDNIDDSDNGKISDNVDGKVKDDGSGLRRNHDNGNGIVRQRAMPSIVNSKDPSKANDHVDDNDNVNGKIDDQRRTESKGGGGGRGCDEEVECAWSWVVLAGLIVACIIGAGQVQCINIYFVIFLEEFKRSTSFTAWISAAQSTALCLTGPLSSLLLPKMGARLTICTGAILMATCLLSIFFATSIPYLIVVFACLGASQCFLTGGNLAAISLYFQRRASFATGIILAGAGIGSMVTGLELEWSVETFGWRGAMLIQAGIVLNMCICASLIFDRKFRTKKEEKRPVSEKNGVAIVGQGDDQTLGDKKGVQQVDDQRPASGRTSMRSLSTDPLFWLSVVSFVGLQSNFATMLTIFKSYVISVGLESSFKMVLTTVGLGSMVGRLLSGPLGQLLCPPLHMTGVAAVCALANALYILVDRPWTLAVVGGTFGFCQGQMVVAYILCMSWVYGHKEMPVVRGHVIFFGVLPGLLCPPIAGYTVDLTGNYNIALMMSSAGSFCCSLCGLLTYFVHRRRARPRSGRSFDVTVTSQPDPGDVTIDRYASCVSV